MLRPIQEVTIDLQKADEIDIQINAVRLNDSAEIHVTFYKDKGETVIDGQAQNNHEQIARKQFVVAGEEYMGWNDDQYIIDLVMNKYGLTSR
ncbi:MAG: hypothetical protein ACYC09_12970 [Bacteroidota bacterium]